MCFNRIYCVVKVLIACIFITLSNSVSAAVFIVDDSYNGVNSATACEQPIGASFYNSITDARLAAATNLTSLPHNIRICPGNYVEDNNFTDPEFVGMTIEGVTSNPSDVQITAASATASVMSFRNDNMTLRNVTIIGGRYGVRSFTSDSSEFDNIVVNKQAFDGFLIQSSNNRITNSSIEEVGRKGIYFSTAGESLLIQSTKVISTINDCIHGRQGDVTILDVSLEDCGRHGVIMNKAAGLSENLSINNLTINNAATDGLYIRNYSASAASDNVNVDNVQINGTGRFGLYLVSNDSIVLNNIKLSNLGNDGVNLNSTSTSIFRNITVDTNQSDGLFLNATSTQNQFQGINISNSRNNGIYLNGGDNNTFEKLSISDSTGIAGIYFRTQSQNNVIKDYQAFNNRHGIYLNNSQANTFSNGDVYNNDYGALLTASAANNEFFDNYIHDNSILGLSISATGDNESNLFSSNCFINPVNNINDAETPLLNLYDNGSMGNFYGSLPAGSGYSEVCVDSDSNNFCDVAYTIPGATSAMDNFPSRDLSSLHSACFSNTVMNPLISLQKLSNIQSDPVNGTSNPKAIPGAIVSYTLNVTNSGMGSSDNNSVVIADKLPPNTKLVLGSPVNPVSFSDGSSSSGLSFTFNGLASTTDDVDFSNDGGSTFITPSADIDGVDITSPSINYIRINPKGVLNGDSGSGPARFELNFNVKVD